MFQTFFLSEILEVTNNIFPILVKIEIRGQKRYNKTVWAIAF